MRKKKSWKRLMALVLSTAMLVPAQAAYATEGQEGETEMEAYAESRAADGFEIEDGVLKKYTGTATEVVIPEGVTSIWSYAFYECSSLTSVTIAESVTFIGDHAFSGCSGLTSISIPEGVTVIGSCAFWDCSGLTEIIIPEGLTRIGSAAFSGCSSLMEVNIPKGVTNIGNATFRDCSSLTEIIIPKGVAGIGGGAFKGCSGLASIKVEEGNAVYDSRENCNAIIETESNTLIAGCKNTIIPEGVMNIGNGAFSGCSSLMGITIPEGMVNIRGEAFMGCSSLTEITIPVGVTSIDRAFSGCSSLTAIKVEEGNAVYDSRENCNAIIETGSNTLVAGCKNTIIPKGVTGIGESAFSGCSGLMELDIPKGVTKIGHYAFSDCSSLAGIVIPKGVTSIESHVFAGCSSLAMIKVEEGNAVYDSRENCNALIETESNTLLEGCQNTTIPEGVTSIKAFAFWGCSSLKEIIIPKGVTKIEDHTFMGCSSLKKISIPEEVASIGNYVFDGCSEELTIYGKTGSYAQTYANENNIRFSSTGVASQPIGKKTISSNNVSLSQTSYIYDGTAKKPTVTVKDGSAILKEGTDYTVTYSNNVNAGTAKVTVTGKGNYTGTVTKEFTIKDAPTSGQKAKELSKCTIMISKTSYTYDGKAKMPTVTVKDGAAVLKEGTDYTVTYSNNVNAGTAKVTVTGKGNYKGTVTKNFTITVKKGTSYKAGTFQYKVTGTSTVSVTGIKDNKITKVKVPKTVKIAGKTFKVTAIANNAFKNNKKITSIEIGDNVKIIGVSAFEGCTKISKATVGKGITEIGGSTFKNCKKLGTITIKSNNLKKVGKNALKGIKATAKIKVPAKKLSAYKRLFKNKGQGKKVKVVK